MVSKKTSLYSLTDHLYYDYLSPSYQSYVGAFSTIIESQSCKEASQDSRWICAMQDEIKVLEKNDTWCIVDLLPGEKAIRSKWIYNIKYHSNGKVDNLKLG